MKQILVIFMCLLPFVAMAEFVNVDFKGQHITIEELSSNFNTYFEVGGSSFVLVNDEIDEIGMRHQDYQQYYNGIVVSDCALYVHSVDGYVTYVNGDIWKTPSAQESSVVSKRHAKKNAKCDTILDSEIDIEIVHVLVDGHEKFYYAYKIVSAEETVYVDVVSGEVVKRLTHIFNSTVCNGQTKYSGRKNFDCEVSNGSYITEDYTRNIVTKYSTVHYGNSTYWVGGEHYTSTSTNWDNRYLTSVTINAVRNGWWCEQFLDNDSYVDLYIKIFDLNGNLLYCSDYKVMNGTERNYPAIFDIGRMIKVPSDGLVIKVYDYDAMDDDCGYSANLTSNTLGTHTWGYTNTTANCKMSCEITSWHPGLDIFWGEQKVYDYYLNVFNRRSFDNANSQLLSILHDPTGYLTSTKENSGDYHNASAVYNPNDATDAFMQFGLGDEEESFITDLHTIAHEYTHLVIGYRNKGVLEYNGESGALNESISDIMAMSIDHYYNPSTFTWRFGKDTRFDGQCYRNFENTADALDPQPDTYGIGQYWVSPSSSFDNGGVHINSGISNHWFYLLCVGKHGTNGLNNSYSVDAIGIDKAQRIIFRALLQYLPQHCTFAQARQLTIQSANDLYPGDVAIERAVTNAWYAVGVGSAFTGSVTPDSDDFQLTPGRYAVVANRNTSSDDNWYYMTSNQPSSTTKHCYQAINTDTDDIDNIQLTNLPESYIWEVVADGNNWKLKNGSQYSTWTSGNTASFDVSGISLTFEIADNQVQAHFNDGTNERYLSLNSSIANNYFAYYSGTAQESYLYFLPITEVELTTIRVKIPSDWGPSISAWVWKDGASGSWQPVSQVGSWYTYSDVAPYNIIFVNGNNAWNGDNNQTIDIAVYDDKCMRIGSNTAGKRTCGNILCEDDPEPEPPVRTDCRNLPYTESFASSQGAFTIENVALDGLNYVWNFASGYGMKASAYVSSTNHPTESWLISPCLELPEDAAITLTFDHVYRYTSAPTTDLNLLVSEDYVSGAPSTATWAPVVIPTYSSGTNWTFVNAGNINLNAYAGKNVTLAFRYKSTSSAAATWEIKNVSVTSSTLTTGVDDVLNQNNATKCIIDGHLFILRGDRIFDATGREVK